MLDNRRDRSFNFNDKQGGYGGGGVRKPVGSARSAIKQSRKMKNHSAGVGSRAKYNSITTVEKNATTARKKLLARQTRELEDLARKLAAAKAKANASYSGFGEREQVRLLEKEMKEEKKNL